MALSEPVRGGVTTGPLDASHLATRGPVIPVIVIDEVDAAAPLATALCEGGVSVLEVTLRTPQALACIREMCASVPAAFVGAGTVRTERDVEMAVEAGCRFIVSPGFTPALARACERLGVPLLPGAATATEVMAACDAWVRFLKFFPASAAGGVPLLKALGGPFADVSFCPTGGITIDSVREYLALPNVKVCGGSWLTPADAVAGRDWGRITALARAAAALRSG